MTPPGAGGADGGSRDEHDPPSDRDRDGAGDGADSGPEGVRPAPARGSTDAWRSRPVDPDASSGPEEGPGGPFPSWGALYTTVIVWMVGLIVLLWLFTVTLRVEIGG